MASVIFRSTGYFVSKTFKQRKLMVFFNLVDFGFRYFKSDADCLVIR